MHYHYHTIAGDRGYMPDYNEAYETFKEAHDDLVDYVSRVEDDCEIPEHFGSNGCTDTIYGVAVGDKVVYADFVGNTHGVQYIELTNDCNESDCLEGKPADPLHDDVKVGTNFWTDDVWAKHRAAAVVSPSIEQRLADIFAPLAKHMDNWSRNNE